MNDHGSDPLYTSFLGRGWSFPPRFDRASGEVRMTEDEEDIRASLILLLGTVAGERFLHPDYGIDMQALLFESLGTTMQTFLKDRVRTAILVHEPRIDLLSLDLETTAQYDGRITLIVDYAVRATNSRYNLVYPFYLSDGNEMRRAMTGNQG